MECISARYSIISKFSCGEPFTLEYQLLSFQEYGMLSCYQSSQLHWLASSLEPFEEGIYLIILLGNSLRFAGAFFHLLAEIPEQQHWWSHQLILCQNLQCHFDFLPCFFNCLCCSCDPLLWSRAAMHCYLLKYRCIHTIRNCIHPQVHENLLGMLDKRMAYAITSWKF